MDFKSVGLKSCFCEFQDVLFLPVIVSIAVGLMSRLLGVRLPAEEGNPCMFILVINQLDVQNVCFTVSLFHASTCFEHHVFIIRRSKLYYTASGFITLKQVSGLKLLKYNSLNMSK